MGYTDPFWLGPAGRMLELPSPVAAGFPAQYERAQAEQRSLAGGTTVDVFGSHRAWAFEFAYRHGGQAALLIARWTSPIVGESLRLIDPLTPNRLSLDVASCGGASTLGGANLANGNVARVRPDVMPDPVDGLLDTGYRWEPPTEDGLLLLDFLNRVPVLPGETVTFRIWARGTTPVTPVVRQYTRAGIETDTDGTSVVLDPAAWTLVQQAVPVAVDTAAVVPGVKTGAGLADPLVELAAAVLTADPNDDGDWTPGGGAPVVTLSAFDHEYQELGRRKMTLTVREA